MSYVKWYAFSLAQLFNELLVAVAFRPAQLEVAMHSLHMIAQLPEQQQQAYTVGSAADRH